MVAMRDLPPDLVLLDVMLPGIDGLEVLRQLRTFSDAYVILGTARAEEVDKLVGPGVGADDYVTKPFSAREVTARVKAVLRRDRGGPNRRGRRAAIPRLDHRSGRPRGAVERSLGDVVQPGRPGGRSAIDRHRARRGVQVRGKPGMNMRMPLRLFLSCAAVAVIGAVVAYVTVRLLAPALFDHQVGLMNGTGMGMQMGSMAQRRQASAMPSSPRSTRPSSSDWWQASPQPSLSPGSSPAG